MIYDAVLNYPPAWGNFPKRRLEQDICTRRKDEIEMMSNNECLSKVKELAGACETNNQIDSSLYSKYEVKRGLRDVNGNGVLTGLTDISEIRQNKLVDGKIVPCDGKLFYRGINVEDLIAGHVTEDRFGFEETTYLLLFGKLPSREELAEFCQLLAHYRKLPTGFVRDVVMKAPSPDMMNALAKSVLSLYAYDKNPDDISTENVLRQCLQLISVFPIISVYGYNSYIHYHKNKSLIIHQPKSELSTAENILRLLRPNKKYTKLEARVLDMSLVLHAEHGGGNNSTFTTHVVTSSGTDTYSTVAASLASLKGPKHGGANIKVVQMFDDLKKKVKHWDNEDEIISYLGDLLDKKAFDGKGLVYGMGHAVYSVSDPRARVFKSFVEQLSREKGRTAEYDLYSAVERLAPQVIAQKRQIYKGVSANVDFFSGFAYSMLDLPHQLYTPIFAIARISGWSAHRLEEIINAGKIIRPAYKSICSETPYVKLSDR